MKPPGSYRIAESSTLNLITCLINNLDIFYVMPDPGRVIENQILHAHGKVGHVYTLEH